MKSESVTTRSGDLTHSIASSPRGITTGANPTAPAGPWCCRGFAWPARGEVRGGDGAVGEDLELPGARGGLPGCRRSSRNCQREGVAW